MGHGNTPVHPENPVLVRIHGLEIHFVDDVTRDQQAGGQTHRQAGHVDQGIPFMPEQIANRHFKIIIQHRHSSENEIGRKHGNRFEHLPPVPGPGGVPPPAS
jgi:hypothetical protein